MSPLRVLAAVLVAATLSACGSGRDDALVVLTASSLVDVTAELAAAWDGGEVLVSDAGSQILAAQVRGGADADLVLLADPAIASALAREGLVSRATAVATNGLAIVTTPASRRRVTGLADLAEPAVRLVLADEGVPLGDATRLGLRRAADLDLGPAPDRVLGNAVSFEDAARVVLAKVAGGEADAAVVYATDAMARADEVATLAWPAAADVLITYTVQRTTDARAGADDLLAFLTSPAADATWEAAGFGR